MKQQLTAAGLWDRLNFILTADHGHIDIDIPNTLVPLSPQFDFLTHEVPRALCHGR